MAPNSDQALEESRQTSARLLASLARQLQIRRDPADEIETVAGRHSRFSAAAWIVVGAAVTVALVTSLVVVASRRASRNL